MSINDLIFKKHNFEESKNNIDELLSILIVNYQIDLPEDFINYLKNFESFEGFINNEYVSFWPFDELIEVNEVNRIFEIEPKTIGIGTNGGGELIALQIEDKVWKVVLMPLIGLDYPIEIGSSFSNFLEKLDNGEKWM